ncbi:hypothetical protein DNTS_017781, partial [Danionella cerebrum]
MGQAMRDMELLNEELRESDLFCPQRVIAILPVQHENVSIWVNPQHYVLHGGVMDEGALGMNKKHIRLPDLLYQAAIKCTTQVVSGGKSQPLILPIMPQ